MEYDILGRMTKRVESEGETFWSYDTATNGIGKLAFVKTDFYKKEKPTPQRLNLHFYYNLQYFNTTLFYLYIIYPKVH